MTAWDVMCCIALWGITVAALIRYHHQLKVERHLMRKWGRE